MLGPVVVTTAVLADGMMASLPEYSQVRYNEKASGSSSGKSIVRGFGRMLAHSGFMALRKNSERSQMASSWTLKLTFWSSSRPTITVMKSQSSLPWTSAHSAREQIPHSKVSK